MAYTALWYATTKPGALAPGVCLLSRGAFPRGRAQLREVFAWQQP